jgi:hypothetical protein
MPELIERLIGELEDAAGGANKSASRDPAQW